MAISTHDLIILKANTPTNAMILQQNDGDMMVLKKYVHFVIDPCIPFIYRLLEVWTKMLVI